MYIKHNAKIQIFVFVVLCLNIKIIKIFSVIRLQKERNINSLAYQPPLFEHQEEL